MALGITHILGGSSSEVLNTKGPEVLVTLVDGRCHRLQPAGLPSEVHIQLKYLASLLPCGSSKLFQHQCGSFSVRPSGRVISADFGRSESCKQGRNMPQLMLYLSGLSADFFSQGVPKWVPPLWCTQVSHRLRCKLLPRYHASADDVGRSLTRLRALCKTSGAGFVVFLICQICHDFLAQLIHMPSQIIPCSAEACRSFVWQSPKVSVSLAWRGASGDIRRCHGCHMGRWVRWLVRFSIVTLR